MFPNNQNCDITIIPRVLLSDPILFHSLQVVPIFDCLVFTCIVVSPRGDVVKALLTNALIKSHITFIPNIFLPYAVRCKTEIVEYGNVTTLTSSIFNSSRFLQILYYVVHKLKILK